MNRFLKTNLPWLSLLGLAVIIVFLTFLFRPKSPEYQIGPDQTVKLMNDQQMHMAFSEIAGKQLIDIRPSELFAQGHPELAINIPVRNLLDEESLELFDRMLENGQEAVIYGSDELQAVAPWLLLQQLGYPNLKVLKGGFVTGNEFEEPALPSTEVMLLDTAAMKVKQEPAKAQGPEKKKPQAIIPVRKEASSGGGC
jgi:rhodanese-related sulfurtransferase